jgi:hypothetical protein
MIETKFPPKHFLKEPHVITSRKTAFFDVNIVPKLESNILSVGINKYYFYIYVMRILWPQFGDIIVALYTPSSELFRIYQTFSYTKCFFYRFSVISMVNVRLTSWNHISQLFVCRVILLINTPSVAVSFRSCAWSFSYRVAACYHYSRLVLMMQ